MRWDDPAVLPVDKRVFVRPYRRLQSWYRAERLGVEPGTYKSKGVDRLNGSLLRREDVARDPTLNFLRSQEIADYALERAAIVKAEGGQLEKHRLLHNMLSSMPLCFNIFGYLRGRPGVAAEVLSEATDLDIATIDVLECEWTPPGPKDRYLDDHTAFDAYVAYRTSAGQRGILAVETKYTDSFSKKVYPQKGHPRPAYRKVTEDPVSGFRPGAYDAMLDKRVNQLWRNLLLAIAWQHEGQFDHAHLVMTGLADDENARDGVELLKSQLVDPPSRLREASIESLVGALESRSESAEWGTALRERYLDLTPVQ